MVIIWGIEIGFWVFKGVGRSVCVGSTWVLTQKNFCHLQRPYDP